MPCESLEKAVELKSIAHSAVVGAVVGHNLDIVLVSTPHESHPQHLGEWLRRALTGRIKIVRHQQIQNTICCREVAHEEYDEEERNDITVTWKEMSVSWQIGSQDTRIRGCRRRCL